MKTLQLSAIAFAAILLVACGSKKTSNSDNGIDTSFATETSDESNSYSSDSNESSYDASNSSADDFSTSSSEDSEESSSSSSSNENWDSILDTYSEYVDKYVSLAKKAKNDDDFSMSEATEMMEKANELNSKLEIAKDDMSMKQWARYMKISAKMAKVAL